MLLFAAPLIAMPKADASRVRTCGPQDSTTILEGSKARLYVVNPYPDFDPENFGVGAESQLYGCLYNANRSWRLDRRFSSGRLVGSALFKSDLIELRAPWIALSQMTLYGVHLGRQDVIAVNLRTGERRVCPVTENLEEGEPSEMVLSRAGRLGWLGKIVYRDTSPRYQSLPTVAICGRGGTTIIEASENVEEGSLGLVGTSLQWTSAGELKSHAL